MLKILLFTFINFFLIQSSFANIDEGLSLIKNRQYEKGYQTFKVEADKGNSEAQFQIAKMYQSGMKPDRKFKNALIWYNLAANNDHSVAQFNLGLMHAIGQGTRKNPKKADAWIAKAYKNAKNPRETMVFNMRVKKLAVYGVKTKY
jgi:hypothetical protein